MNTRLNENNKIVFEFSESEVLEIRDLLCRYKLHTKGWDVYPIKRIASMIDKEFNKYKGVNHKFREVLIYGMSFKDICKE